MLPAAMNILAPIAILRNFIKNLHLMRSQNSLQNSGRHRSAIPPCQCVNHSRRHQRPMLNSSQLCYRLCISLPFRTSPDGLFNVSAEHLHCIWQPYFRGCCLFPVALATFGNSNSTICLCSSVQLSIAQLCSCPGCYLMAPFNIAH